MKIGTVIGAVWSTKKVAGLTGYSLLTVQVDSGVLVAVDFVGAGVGDPVLILTGGAARMGDANLPVDAAIVGIMDSQGV